jgi:Flp pilus assembly protein TadG
VVKDAMAPERVARTNGERGAALLEVALTLPLMLLVAVGIFEFGRAYQTWQILTNAAREGARVAVLPGSDDEAVEERVMDYLEAGLLPAAAEADITITDTEIPFGGAGGTTSASQVEVAYPFTFMVLQPIAQLINPDSTTGAPLTMTATATMRNEM